MFKTTVQYIQSNMEVFLLPFASIILTGIWFLIWLTSAVCIFSVGTPEARTDFPFITNIVWSKGTRAVMVYHVFALLWINAFIVGGIQFIIGASTCIWYFECKTDSLGRFTLGRATWWFFRYNWPSVALGALIIAIC